MIEQKIDDREDEQRTALLNNERLERVTTWGGTNYGVSHVYRPATIASLREVFQLARENGRSVGLRGGGNSYGDAALNSENILIDLKRMNRILKWEPETGQITVEPGVTLRRLWEYVLEDGWWVPVATGTQNITIGGGAAMNVHGKNAWQMGTFGDHIYEFDLMLPSGEIIRCNREQNRDIFYAAIGGIGMLGCFTAITLRLKRIYSGLLNVTALIKPNLQETIAYFDENVHRYDYIVGWLDAFSKGKAMGRSEIHVASHLKPNEDPHPAQTLRPHRQKLTDDVMGVVSRSAIWRFQQPFWNQWGMRLVNIGKYRAAQLKNGAQYQQPHALFHFLLDYFDWNKAFGRGGLIQYQPFIPKEAAAATFQQIFELCHRHRIANFLSVLKRHRPDDFLLSYSVDGYSMAMDFRITQRNRAKIIRLTQEMDKIVLAANGRFYFAKDSTLRPEVARAYLGQETVAKFHQLKQRCDPDHILETNLWRRLFAT